MSMKDRHASVTKLMQNRLTKGLSLIGESNFFEGVVVQREKDWIGVQTTKGLAIRTKPKEGIQKDQKVNITLRPERVQIHPGPTIDSNQFVGEIKEVVYLGETIKYIVMFDTGDQVVVKSQNLKGEIPWGRGEKIHIGWKFENCFIV